MYMLQHLLCISYHYNLGTSALNPLQYILQYQYLPRNILLNLRNIVILVRVIGSFQKNVTG